MKKRRFTNLARKKNYFGIFRHKFEKKNCLIWNQPCPVCLIAKFYEKWKCPNLAQKKNYFGVFGHKFEKNIVLFEVSLVQFCLIGKFLEKMKKLKFEAKMHYLISFGGGLKILPYLKLASSTSSKSKIWRKNNMEKLGTKIVLFVYF